MNDFPEDLICLCFKPITMSNIHPTAIIDESAQIHPTALIGANVEICENVIIGPYCIIGYPSEWKGKESNLIGVIILKNTVITGHVTIDSGAEIKTYIGESCYLMKHCHVGHDCEIQHFVTISPGAVIGGHTIVFNHCNIGINASIHQKTVIPPRCMVGMGAVVTKKTIMFSNKKIAGVPAKIIGDNIYGL
jgi:UDP-N-acetylglucosamine acyltransferase